MDGETRRKRILQLLSEQTKPLSGTALAKQFGVSRQVIVQDIALLKSKEPAIISTYRGYVLGRPERVCERVFWVRHSNEQIQDELNTIVDNGGEVCTVIVEHELYGRISVELPIRSRRYVQEFVENVSKGQARPLKELVHDGRNGKVIWTPSSRNYEQKDILWQKMYNKKDGLSRLSFLLFWDEGAAHLA